MTFYLKVSYRILKIFQRVLCFDTRVQYAKKERQKLKAYIPEFCNWLAVLVILRIYGTSRNENCFVRIISQLVHLNYDLLSKS